MLVNSSSNLSSLISKSGVSVFSPTPSFGEGGDLTVKVISQGLPNIFVKVSCIRPKYLVSVVFLTKEELHPISIKNLPSVCTTSARWVWENHVENMAEETETLIDCSASFQTVVLSMSIKPLFTKLSTMCQGSIYK